MTKVFVTLVVLFVLSARGLAAPPAACTSCNCAVTGICTCAKGSCDCADAGEYRWVVTAKSNQIALYKGSTQLGNYWVLEAEYKRLVVTGTGDQWVRADCPTRTPPAEWTGGAQSAASGVCRPTQALGESGSCVVCGHTSHRRCRR